ncbi:hypothetical protein [uncultured Desulfosarcina sp.]|uniref:hypothetical protein n=1 Tax=uncultured Desulfosarcina sp. TaxID=218289 RepID=UPI0029C6C588|nr:hypothetical protein [uncultured Desulfosarcina sp.]
MDIESIRIGFRPEKIVLLMVGESPPAAGDFFYVKSQMTKFTAKTFELAHGKKIPPDDQQNFLEYFKRCGCYLEDICCTPVDDIPTEDRQRKLAEAVVGFSDRLARLRPLVVVVILKKIAAHSRIAAAMANLDVPIYVLPFPGYGHQKKYINGLRKIIRKHVNCVN